MLCPVRCYSCGKVVADKYYEFKEEVDKLHVPKEGDIGIILDKLGFERYCCRRMMMGHVELIDDVMKYNV